MSVENGRSKLMNKKEEVHPAVQMLLDRMDRYPEEFINPSAWGGAYEPYKGVWNAREKELFKKKWREIRMAEMERNMCARLLRRK
jgi:hypothetical protein